MNINFVIAQVFGMLGLIASVCSMQFKKRKYIFVALLLLNLFSALNFVFLGTFASAYISFFAIAEMIINYVFERKNKSVPKIIIAIYIVINIILGALNYTGIIDLLPIICAIIFCITVLNKKEQNIRKLMIANQILWLIFDVVVGAYFFAVSNVLTIVSTCIAIYRFNEKKRKTKKR